MPGSTLLEKTEQSYHNEATDQTLTSYIYSTLTHFRATATASLVDLSSSPDRDREQRGDNRRPMSPSDSCSSGGAGADRGGMSLEEFIRHMREKRRVSFPMRHSLFLGSIVQCNGNELQGGWPVTS